MTRSKDGVSRALRCKEADAAWSNDDDACGIRWEVSGAGAATGPGMGTPGAWLAWLRGARCGGGIGMSLLRAGGCGASGEVKAGWSAGDGGFLG